MVVDVEGQQLRLSVNYALCSRSKWPFLTATTHICHVHRYMFIEKEERQVWQSVNIW